MRVNFIECVWVMMTEQCRDQHGKSVRSSHCTAHSARQWLTQCWRRGIRTVLHFKLQYCDEYCTACREFETGIRAASVFITAVDADAGTATFFKNDGRRRKEHVDGVGIATQRLSVVG